MRHAHVQRALGTGYRRVTEVGSTQSRDDKQEAYVNEARVLLVGAGGIGCELLKNLVLTGFGEIHVVDLDTIDLSNLNRQFLFGHEHIKRAKALVAKESAGKFNPHVKIEAHHANIKDPQFNITWYQDFNMVFNALDNMEARRHVNKMCLAADVPLIESGTTGFNGQVQVIKRGVSECYDCSQKEAPKSFPVCTIRSTPSQPIHCIVWAKSYLFSEVFGTSEDDTPELDTREDAENAEEIEVLRKEARALKRIRDSMGSEDFPRKIFDKVYVEDIERLKDMEDMWKSRRRPEPLDFEKLSQEAMGVGKAIADSDQAVWTAAENYAVFASSLQRLSSRLEEQRAQSDLGNAAAVLTFDKDDKDILDFVAASANLRSIVFGIEPKTEFDIKQMAGNIIPAIATTNAMVASLCVLQGFKVLRGELVKANSIFLARTANRLTSASALAPPNPACPVCGVCQSRVHADFERATLSDLVDGILRQKLGYGQEFSVSTDVGVVYDPDEEDNLSKKLTDLGIKQDSFLSVVDEEDENPRVNLNILVLERSIPADKPPINLPEMFEIARKRTTKQTTENGTSNGINGAGAKRKRDAIEIEADIEADMVRKRGKVVEEVPALSTKQAPDDAVVIEDTGNGSIVIDDD